jgi:hypothetical protein
MNILIQKVYFSIFFYKYLHPWSQKAPSALAKGMNDDHIKEIKIK